MLLVAEISLQGPRIVAPVGQGEAAGVPQHVRVHLEPAEPGGHASALQKPGKPAVVNGEPRSEVNTNGDFGSCSAGAGAAPAVRRP